jgi:hypothetical protein
MPDSEEAMMDPTLNAPADARAAPAEPDPIPEPRGARLGPALAALATFALHAACWGRYGIFRDELYFLVCGQRLSAGYVDQPPGIALVARLAYSLFGTWVPGLRAFSWIAAAATVYLTGRLAARISGSGAAATLAAVAASSCLALLGASQHLSLNAFEPLLVMATVLVLLRLTQGGDPRLWLAAGGLAGLSVLMKYTAAPLCLALLAGIAVTPARRALRTWWALAGATVGALVVLPNFLWQATHGFPFLEMVHAAVTWKNTPTTPLQFLVGLLVTANPLIAPLWVGGLGWLLFAPRARASRFIGVGGLIQLLALTFGHAKPYYGTALLPLLLAGGAVAVEALVRSRIVRRAYGGLIVTSALALSPLAIPILPLDALVRYLGAIGSQPPANERGEQSVLPQHFADQFGWRELTAGVARVYRSLPAEEQAHAVVFTPRNYGSASAVEILGPEYGLPRGIAISGHNQFWFWGIPSGRGDPLIAVSDPGWSCRDHYREQVLGEQLPKVPYAMPGDNGHTIWICRGLIAPLLTLPPSVRHFD